MERYNGDKSNKFIERNVKTRWNSTLRMIQDAIQCKDTINEYTKLNEGMIESLTNNDWVQLLQICDLLKPFEVATRRVSESRPTMTEALGMFLAIRTLYIDAELIRDNKVRFVKNEFMRNMDKSLAVLFFELWRYVY